ncbi:MAG: hypothetical protein PHH70_05655 [Candidatus Gracilibacteria bacterium]|nr:hypothetical protein [Candidatus Gracilibacteria bacterium]
MQKIRINLYSQNMSATKNGSHVCHEKKRSPVNMKFGRKSDNETVAGVGNGPMCVRLIDAERTNTKSEILFNVNGAFHGYQRQRKAM